MKLEKYINGFENGWFSTKHEKDGKTFSNCSSCGCPITELNIEPFLNKNCIIYCHEQMFPFVCTKTLEYETEEFINKSGFKVTKIKYKDVTFAEYYKNVFSVKFKKVESDNPCMWFAVWGDEQNECWGSKGDGSSFEL